MAKKKILLNGAHALLFIGMGLALWALIAIVQYPALRSAGDTDSFRFCLGFGFIAIAICGIILFSPKSDNALSNNVGKVLGLLAGFEGTLLIVCAIMFLR